VPADLDVDTDDLHSRALRLRRAAADLGSLVHLTDRAADACGHAGLAVALHRLESSWTGRRAALVDRVEVLGAATAAAGRGFEAEEARLARAAQEGAAGASAGPAAGSAADVGTNRRAGGRP